MFLVDSHSHIFSEEFDADLDDVVKRYKENGVGMVVMPNIDLSSLPRILSVAETYPSSTRMALGIHPEAVDTSFHDCLSICWEFIEKHKMHPQFCAIGEIGLDFYWDDTYKKEQIEALHIQIDWALKLNKPIILHTRAAHLEMVQVISEYEDTDLKGVFHSFDGTLEELEKLLTFKRFYIGLNGIITFKKNEELRKTVSCIPIDKLLIETDAPYLSPVPKRGKRNEPAHIIHVLNCLSDIFSVSQEKLAFSIQQNYESLFGTYTPKTCVNKTN